MANNIDIPQDLHAAGYRLHHGTAEDGVIYDNKYWWTWSGGQDVDSPVDEFETPGLAIEDARRNKAVWENATGAIQDQETSP